MGAVSTVSLWTLRILAALIIAAFNLIPIYGIKVWHWDAFQILILYWTETVVFAFWSLVRIEFVPVDLLGIMTVNDKPVKPSHRMMIGFFAFHSGMFIAVHLLFLCFLFSGDWFSRLHGFRDALYTFYIASGAWIPLLVLFIGGGIEALTGEFHPHFVDAIAMRFGRRPAAPAATPQPSRGGDAVGRIVGMLYGRIVMMQLAIIFGAMAAQSYGSLAPLYIVIGLKTLFDFGRQLAPASSAPSSAGTFTAGSTQWKG